MKRGKQFTIKINFSNRAIYTLITVGILIILGVGVYAYGTNNPSILGHSANEIEGVCKTDGTGCPTGVWTISGNNIYNPNTGNVEITNTISVKKAVLFYLDTGKSTKSCEVSCKENEPSGVDVESGACIAAWVLINYYQRGDYWTGSTSCKGEGSSTRRCLCTGIIN